MKYKNTILATTIAGLLIGCGSGGGNTYFPQNDKTAQKVAFGEKVFVDKSLSLNKTMSCATCHSSLNTFIDPRVTNRTLGASLGDDDTSIGDRNTPTATYASFSPDFHFDADEGLFIGGQFLDGRSVNLKDQAKGPFLNPLEMGMPDADSVMTRVQENEDYVKTMKDIYGNDIFEDVNASYDALADSIAEFEKTDAFSSFDSKYDKFLAGDYNLSNSEARGMAIFTNEDEVPGAGRCTLCHPITNENDTTPLMTDFSYDNLGVPINTALRTANGMAGTKDVGLFGNNAVNDEDLKGAFKVSSLRNVSASAPFMHNGLFKNLKTVVHFYNTRDVVGAINPETNSTWEEGEFQDGRNTEELGDLGLSNQDEDDLVSFMKIFTDERFEHLNQ